MYKCCGHTQSTHIPFAVRHNIGWWTCYFASIVKKCNVSAVFLHWVFCRFYLHTHSMCNTFCLPSLAKIWSQSHKTNFFCKCQRCKVKIEKITYILMWQEKRGHFVVKLKMFFRCVLLTDVKVRKESQRGIGLCHQRLHTFLFYKSTAFGNIKAVFLNCFFVFVLLVVL